MATSSAFAAGGGHAGDARLDRALRIRAHAPTGHSRIILTVEPGVVATDLIQRVAGMSGRRLPLLGGLVAEVPDGALDALAALPGVRTVSLDRPNRRHPRADRRHDRIRLGARHARLRRRRRRASR